MKLAEKTYFDMNFRSNPQKKSIASTIAMCIYLPTPTLENKTTVRCNIRISQFWQAIAVSAYLVKLSLSSPLIIHV